MLKSLMVVYQLFHSLLLKRKMFHPLLTSYGMLGKQR